MPCEIKGNAIICSRGPKRKTCFYCGRPSDKLCDFPVGGGTCDKPMCGMCAVHVPPDTDYCKGHAKVRELLPAGDTA